MKYPTASRRVLLLAVTVVFLLFVVVFSQAADLISHEEIQTALESPSAQSAAKDLSGGTWFGDVFVLPYSSSEPYDLYSGGGLNVEPRQSVARSFLAENPDNYDFLLILTRFDFVGEDGVLGFYWEIRNDTQGIGIQQFDIGDAFGSNRLQGYIDGGRVSQYLLEDGSMDSNRVQVVLNHEMAHRWSGRCTFIDDDGQNSTALLGLDAAHWSYLLDSDASYLYGSDWRDNHDGSFTAADIESGYSELDLYLMGLLPPDEVAPFTLLENPAISAEALPHLGDTIDAAPVTVDIDQVIAAEGARIPAFSDAPKENRVALIYLVEDGAEIDQSELDSIKEIRSLWMRSFFRETGGRAVVDVGKAGSSPVSTSDFDLQAAKLWLERAAEGELWRDSQSTTVRDTTEALTALARFASSSALVVSGGEALGDVQAESVELLARQIEALSVYGSTGRAEALAEELVEREGEEGIWGAFGRYSEDPVSSACVLRALSGLGAHESAVDSTWAGLLARQNSDGGWSWFSRGPSAVYPTLEVLLAGILTQSDPESSPAFSQAAGWVLTQQRSDGGFGDSFSGILETSLFLRVFSRLAVDQSKINEAIVFLAQRQENNGSWSGRIVDSAVATTALAPYFMADPYVLSDEIMVTPPSPFEDDELVLQAAVRNSGGTLPSGSAYRWELLDAAHPETIWASISGQLPEIVAGGWAAVQDNWTPNVPAGTYLLRLNVDPDFEIDDGDPGNNRATIPLEIKGHPQGVDLSLAADGVLAGPDSISSIPQLLTLSGIVSNRGRTDASATTIAVFDGDPAQGRQLATQPLNVPALTSAPFSISLSLAEARAYSLVVMLDPDDLTHDENRMNNSAEVFLGLNRSFDPAVDSGSFAVDPMPATTGDLLSLSATLRNAGTETIEGMQVAFSYTLGSPPTEYPIAMQEIDDPLDPGESRVVVTQWRPAISGSPISLSIEVDPQSLIQDSDRSNNRASIDIVVDQSDLPNLSVSPESLSFDPENAEEGHTVSISAQILNNGINPSGAFSAVIRLDDPESGQLIATSAFGTLDAGATVGLSGNWTVDDSADRLVYIVLDQADEVAEFNEEDNQAFRVLGVESMPDLLLNSASIVATPSFPHSGEELHFDVTVENIGDQATPSPTMVELLDSGGNLLQSAPLEILAGHGQASVLLNWQAPSSPGESRLYFRVNGDQLLPEQSYENNEALLNIAIQDGDFYLSPLFFSPNGDGVMDTVTAYFRQDADSLNIVDSRNMEIRKIPVPAGEHSALWDGRDEDGRVVPDGAYGLSCGTMRASVIVDTNRVSLADHPSGTLVKTTLLSTPELSYDFRRWNILLSPADGAAFFNQTAPKQALVRWVWGQVEELGDPLRGMAGVSLDEQTFLVQHNSDSYYLDFVHFPGPTREERTDTDGSVSLSPDGNWFLESYDGRQLYFGKRGDPGASVTAVDLNNDYPDLSTSCFSEPIWSPSGRRVLVVASVRYDPNDISENLLILMEPDSESGAIDVRKTLLPSWPDAFCDADWGKRNGLGSFYPSKGDSYPYLYHAWLSADFSKETLFLFFEDDWSEEYQIRSYSLETGTLLSSAENNLGNLDESYGLSNNGRAVMFSPVGPEKSWDIVLENWQTGEKQILPASTDPYAWPIWSPMDKYIYFAGSDALDVVGTAENLTVGLKPHVLFGNAGISLSVLVVDRNLESYRIDYAPADDPEDLAPIGAPSNEAIFGETWGTWLPPAKGRFLIRLSALDRAGNNRTVTKSVVWNGDNDIANLALDHRYVSPFSSPGVKDSLSFHYLVLRPSNLVFEIRDEDDRLLKTIPVAADQVGERSTSWDGRDQDGNPVPDGHYTLNYLGAAWPFVVDSMPPEISFQLGDDVLRRSENGDCNGWTIPMSGHCRDNNLDHWSFQWRQDTSQTEWLVLAEGGDEMPTEGFPFPENPSGIAVAKDFRLVATDLAGNRSEVLRAHTNEFLSFTTAQPVCQVGSGVSNSCPVSERPSVGDLQDACRALSSTDGETMVLYPDYNALLIQSTVDADQSAEIRLEYRRPGIAGLPAGEWQNGDIELGAVPVGRELSFEDPIVVDGESRTVPRTVTVQLKRMYWNHPDLGAGSWEVRLLQADRNGQDVSSAVITFEPPNPLVLEVMEMQDDGLHYRVTNVVARDLSDIRMQSRSGVPGTPWTDLSTLGTFLKAGQTAEGVLACEIFQLPTNPQLRAAALFGSDVSNAVPIAVDYLELGLPGPYEVGDCAHDRPDSFGIIPGWSDGLLYSAGGFSSPPVFGALIDPTGAPILGHEWRIDGQVIPTIGGKLDLSGYSEGAHSLTVSIEYPPGRNGLYGQCASPRTLIIDRTEPTVSIQSPSDGATVCPENGMIVIEAEAADNQDSSLEYGVVVDGEEYGDILEIDGSDLSPGAHDLIVRVRDNAGLSSCDGIRIYTDETPKDDRLSVAPSLFSPVNDTGAPTTAEIDFSPGAPVTYTTEIRSLDTGDLISVMTGAAGHNETINLAWDGRDPLGALVPDGQYSLSLRMETSCGTVVRAMIPDQASHRPEPIEVDSSPPIVEISEPLDGAQIGVLAQIKGRVEDRNLDSWTIEVQVSGECEDCWTQVAAGDEQTLNPQDLLGLWETGTFEPGEYSLRVRALDSAGNRTITNPISLILRQKGLIESFTADPTMFSPNGDGRLDFEEIDFSLIQDAVVTLRVLDDQGLPLRTFYDAEVLSGGSDLSYAPTWDGTNDGGAFLPSGIYTLVLHAEDAASPAILPAEDESITLVVDTTAPDLVFHQPADHQLSALPLSIVVSAEDEHPGSYELTISGPAGFHQVLKSGSGSLTSVRISTLDGLPNGAYELWLRATDRAENSAELPLQLNIDSTAPAITFLSPSSGAYVNGRAGLIPLRARIEEEHLASFRWSYAPGLEPEDGDFVEISVGSALPAGGLVEGFWNPSGISDGPYTLRIAATDELGMISEARQPVNLDSTPPDVAVDWPSEGRTLGHPTSITGHVSDPALASWKLDLRASDGTLSHLTGGVSEVDGLLFSWDPLPADGAYALLLSGEDGAGNRTEVTVNLRVEAANLPAPINLTATAQGADVLLTWAPGTGPLPAGYVLWRQGNPASDEWYGYAVTDTSYLDEGLPAGTYTYRVQASTADGSLGPSSNEVSVTLNFTPPVVHISSPMNAARINGDVDIYGTAYRETGFKEYRLSLKQMPEGDSQLLRVGTTPVLADRLAQWPALSSGAPEGLYQLSLEAEDNYGNLVSELIEITLDTTPPSTPVLTEATLSAADGDALANDVHVVWQMDTPPSDLAGYYLYRNGRLANAPGIVMGDQSAYQLPGFDFDDSDVPDGRYIYTVTAVDMATNESPYSNPSDEILIDTHRPHAIITFPADGSEVFSETEVRAETPDEDIVSLYFQLQADGDPGWTNFGSTLTTPPFTATFVPPGLGLYHLRAVAADAGGEDLSPEAISVVVSLHVPTPTARVDEGTVSLSWPPLADPAAVQGINIYRNGSLLTSTALSSDATNLIDADLSDGAYVYTLTLIDQDGQETTPSPDAPARVYTPYFDFIPPILPEGVAPLSGGGLPSAVDVVLEARVGGGNFETVASVECQPPVFAFGGVQLDSGINVFRVQAVDSEGNRSHFSRELTLVVAAPAVAPSVLDAAVNGNDVNLSWQPGASPDFAGVSLRRNEVSIGETAIPFAYDSVNHQLSASAGDISQWALMLDGDPGTGWTVSPQPDTQTPAFWQWTWPTPIESSEIDLAWSNSVRQLSFEMDLRVNGTWLWWDSQRVVHYSTSWNWQLPAGLRISGIRFRLEKADFCNGGQCAPELMEVELNAVSRQTGTTYTDTGLSAGAYNYDIAELNSWGMASERVDAQALIGIEPPAAPSNLLAEAGPYCGQISLSWAVPDPEPTMMTSYVLYRAAAPAGPYRRFLSVPPEVRTVIDQDLSFGTRYYYTVRSTVILDGIPVESGDSNEASAIVECDDWDEPVITSPTTSGQPLVLPPGSTDIAGTGHPGATIRLLREADEIAETEVSSALKEDFHATLFGRDDPESYLAISADARVVAFDAEEEEVSSFRVIDLETGLSTLIRHSDLYLRCPALSPDGTKVAFVAEDDEAYKDTIIMYDLSSGVETFLSASEGWKSGPAFSPDGGQLVYLEDPDDDDWNDLIVLDIESGERRSFSNVAPGFMKAPIFSPDGEKVLLVYRAWPGVSSFRLKNLQDGGVRQLDFGEDAVLSQTPFSPDGRSLVYSDMPEEHPEEATVWRYWIVDGRKEQLSQQAGEFSPVFIDDQTVAYYFTEAEGLYQMRTRKIGGNPEILLSEIPEQKTVIWDGVYSGLIVSGRGWAATDLCQDLYLFFRKKARFEFPDVPLEPGANFFAARQYGGASPQDSNSIEIDVPVEAFPDAVVEDLVALPSPALVGGAVTIQGHIRNAGGSTLTDCPVNLLRIVADGSSEILLSRTINLQPGAATLLDYEWPGSGVVDDLRLVLEADPDDLIRESNEFNNNGFLTIPVRDPGAVEVSTTTDREIYSIGGMVQIHVELLSTGFAEDYDLRTTIEDAMGAEVALVDTRSMQDFGPAEEAYDLSWPPADIVEGPYRVKVEATRASALAAEATSPFEVSAPTGLIARVSTDRSNYAVGSVVNILGWLSNPAAVSRQAYTARFEISDSSGVPVDSRVVEVPAIPANGSIEPSWGWSTDGRPVGLYRVLLIAEDPSGEEAARSQAFAFSLSEGAAALSGSVSIDPFRLEPSGSVSAFAQIRNAGDSAVNDLPVSLALTEPGTWSVLASAEGIIDLPAGGSTDFAADLPVDGLDLGQYLVVLTVNPGVLQQLASTALSLADLSPPDLTLVPPASTCGELEILVHAHDALTGVLEVFYSVDGEEQRYPLYLQPQEEGGDLFSSTWRFQAGQEGEHTIEIGARDRAGNESPGLSFSFTPMIDVDSPIVTITGIPAGSCSNTPVTPEITATDSNLSTVVSTLNGESFLPGTTIADEGNYSLIVTATDECGNETVQTADFSIDVGPPVIQIDGVADGDCLVGPVTINYSAVDANLETLSATLNAQAFADGGIVAAEGEYTLVVSAEDSCGNQRVETLSFTIDNELPAISVEGIEDGSCTGEPVTIDFDASDDHLAGVSATLNGEPYISGTPVTDEGVYALVVTATEECGRETTETRNFVIDLAAPLILISGIPTTSCSNLPVTPEITATDSNLSTVVSTLNGESFLPGTTITEEGNYNLIVTATDECGNETVQTADFSIDVGPPVIQIDGVADGDCLVGPVTINYSAVDANLETLSATLNAQAFADGGIVAAEGEYTLVVSAGDSCGNQRVETLSFTIDNELPAISVEGIEDGSCTGEPVTIDFDASDDHLAGVSATLNGEPYISGTPVTDDGVYALVVTATEECGRETTETRNFVIDLAAPLVLISGIPTTSCSNLPVTPEITATDSNLSTVVSTLNGEIFTPGSTISEEGNYNLIVTATDECGNETVQTADFVIDLTPPEITVSGAEDGQSYVGSVDLDWSVSDLNDVTVDASLDGAAAVPPLTVDAMGSHVLEISAMDCAENQSSLSIGFTIEAQGPPPFEGSLLILPDIVERGQDVNLEASISNEGGDAVDDILVAYILRSASGGDAVAELHSTISLGPNETRNLSEVLETRSIPPGNYIMTLEVSGVFFGADYELELDQGSLEVLLPVAIPGIGGRGRLLLMLLIALSGLWILRRSM